MKIGWACKSDGKDSTTRTCGTFLEKWPFKNVENNYFNLENKVIEGLTWMEVYQNLVQLLVLLLRS